MVKLFELSLRLNGFPIGKAKHRLRQIISVPDADYHEFLEQKKGEIATFHLENNPFYQKLTGNQKFTSWNDLPIMVKRDLQRPLTERLSNAFTTKNVYINKTSGSSGDPFVFAKDKFCHALIWANIMRRFALYGIDFNDSYQARFYGMPLNFPAKQLLRIKDFLSNRYRFSIFDLSDSGIENIIGEFRKRRFTYINGYTSPIVLIASYLRKKELILKEICPTLKVCIVTSEMLLENDRVLLQEQFGIPVVNEYGASELDVIAFENPNGKWLVNAETTFVEIVDEAGNRLPNGEEGRIIVTSLYNKAHPMIRYDVGDTGILHPDSTAKYPILQKLSGRTNDFALLPSGKKPAGMTFYSITKALFADEGNVKEFVIWQTKLDTFEIRYTSEKPLNDHEIKNMERVLSNYLEGGLTFCFVRQEKLDRSASGKLKQFVSLIEK